MLPREPARGSPGVVAAAKIRKRKSQQHLVTIEQYLITAAKKEVSSRIGRSCERRYSLRALGVESCPGRALKASEMSVIAAMTGVTMGSVPRRSLETRVERGNLRGLVA